MASILAIDLGSTQMKLMVMDEQGNPITVVSETYPTYVVRPDYLEQKPADWEHALRQGVRQLRQKVDMDQIEVISFSGHMSGVILLDQEGNVMCPCMMLADNRCQKQSEALTLSIGEEVRKQTGNPVNNAFSLPKLLWLKENQTELYRKAWVWLSPKDYVRYCLTGSIQTEYTDAYNSLCISSQDRNWDQELIKESTLKTELFPPISQPFDLVGRVTACAEKKYGLREGIPVAAGGADMACAVLGSGCSEAGETALTLGTCATFFSVVQKIHQDCYGKVTFHPTVSGNKLYALGSHINGGAAVNWISSVLSENEKIDYEMLAELSEKADKVIPGSNGLLTLPFLNGSGSPWFCASDRAHILGLKMNTTRAELFRSQLEGISYNLRQTLLVFREMADVKSVMLAGGGTRISVWPSVICDVFGIPVELFDDPDVSARGAALLGGKAAGMFDSPEKIAIQKRNILETKMPDRENYRQYQKLYEKYLSYYKVMHELDLREQYGKETGL